jgi:predicted DNA-binding transcriptional regulator AlpA
MTRSTDRRRLFPFIREKTASSGRVSFNAPQSIQWVRKMTAQSLSLANDPLLTRPQLAEMIGCTLQHLENLAIRGDGPAMIKIGRLVRYRQSEVERWFSERTVASTTAARCFRLKAAAV